MATIEATGDRMPTFEPASLDDLHQAAGWVTSADECRLWAGMRVTFPIDFDALAEQVQWAKARGYRLVDAQGLAGFGQLVPKPQAGRLHLTRVIVQPGRRGRGYGKALVRGLVDAAFAQGAAVVSLNVFPENVAAAALYTALGFEDAQPPAGEAIGGARYMVHAAGRGAEHLTCTG